MDGLLEAFRNEQIRPVPIKTVTQQVLGTLHRLRSGWLADRTRAINSLRGLLRELGFFIPEGRKHVLPDAWEIIQDPTRGLPDALKPSPSSLCQEIVSLSTRIEEVEAQLEALAKQVPVVARLRSVPGIGLLTATLLDKHSDGETGRTGTGKADNKPGLRGRFHRLAPLCADSIMAHDR